MIKRILAFFAVAAVALSMVSPAYAATLSGAEQKVLNKFEGELKYWMEHTDFDNDHKQQYYTEAKNALLAVDLTDAACKEFEGVVDQIHKVFVDAGCKTRHDLWLCYPKIAPIINTVGTKYYKLHVTVSDHQFSSRRKGWCDGHWAKVTYELNNKTYTAVSTSKVVKQTGFDLTRTVMVMAASALVLVVAYFVSRKLRLFV